MPSDFLKSVKVCDVCGSDNALLRTITYPDGDIINWLSGSTCKRCLDSGKEDDYVEKLENAKIAEDKEYNTLLDELAKLDIRTNGNPDAGDVERITIRLDKLDKNQEVRDLLGVRFQRIRLDEKAWFICDHGIGIKGEKCGVCGQDYSYLTTVVDHFEGHVKMLDEIAGFFCADCITTGILSTHIDNAFRELMLFHKECEDVTEKYEFFKSIMGTSQFTEEENRNFMSTFEHGKELEVHEAMYKKKAERMEKARLGYTNVPVNIVIKTAGEGDVFSLCGKICDKDHKCGDLQNAGGI